MSLFLKNHEYKKSDRTGNVPAIVVLLNFMPAVLLFLLLVLLLYFLPR